MDSIGKILTQAKMKFVSFCIWKIQVVKWLQAGFELGYKHVYLVLASCTSSLGSSFCGLTSFSVRFPSGGSKIAIATLASYPHKCKELRMSLFPKSPSKNLGTSGFDWFTYPFLNQSLWLARYESHAYPRRWSTTTRSAWIESVGGGFNLQRNVRVVSLLK